MASQFLDEKRSMQRRGVGGSRASRKQKLELIGDDVARSIVDRLHFGAASAAEIAMDLSLPADAVRRRLRKLVGSGIVQQEGRTRRRGVSEYLYATRPTRAVLRRGDSIDFPARLHEESHARLLRAMFREAMGAVSAGTYQAHDEWVMTRFAIPLDIRGWREACVIHEDLVESIIDTVERAQRQIESAGSDQIFPVCAIIQFFEAPSPWPPPVSEKDHRDVPMRRAWGGEKRDELVALADPLRLRLLDALSLDPMGVGDLASRLQVPKDWVRYELGRFRDAGVVEIHSRRRRRGTEELIYVCQSRSLVVDTSAVQALSDEALQQSLTFGVTDGFRAALAATKAGAFRGHEDFANVRMPGTADAETFKAVSAHFEATLERLFELREECLQRLADGTEIRRSGFSNLLLFELAAS
jgi:DNA-binding transcriptional ArsR family regulator